MTNTVDVFSVPDPDGFDTLFAQRFDSNDDPVGPTILVSPLHAEAELERVLVLSDGGFVVAYSIVDGSGASGSGEPPTYLYTREFTSDGALLKTSLIGTNTPSGDEGFNSTSILGAVALRHGDYAAVIRHDGTDVSTETLRYVDAAGNQTDHALFTTYFDINPTLVNSDAVIASSPNGGFTVSWSARYPNGIPGVDPGGAEQFRQSYDASGRLVTTSFIDFGHKTDLVVSSISITLSPTFHNLTLDGFDPINARGNALDNVIVGNEAKNHLTGGAGDDRLDGGLGSDYLGGGAGRDRFVFDTAIAPKFNSDTIGDFVHGQDKIELSSSIFTHLAKGVLSAAHFSGSGAVASHGAQIIYDARGNLLYDLDGVGGVAPVQFAAVTGHPHLTASDFIVV